MTVIDGAILVLLVVALAHGFFRGLLRPLFTWIFVVVGVIVAFYHPGLAGSLAPNATVRPLVGLVLVIAIAAVGGLVARVVAPPIYTRIPVIRTFDRVGGMVFSFVASLFSIFMILNSLVTVDTALAPVTGNAQASAAQIAQIRQLLAEHPELSSLINPDDLAAAQSRLGATGTVASADIGTVSGVLGAWRQIHTQLAESRIAPVVFGIFDHLPLIGHNRGWPTG